ncbi:MAG: hypothetical protein Ct9H90mP20_4310 [Candidatus Neomarinimicrobiota bacterium]|nr:MAG: hypothetical protein Ct9H90mP20_4310 [Candidatus Neomarinimicrobiota bacterium]
MVTTHQQLTELLTPKKLRMLNRYSMPLFLHPKDEVVLNNVHTARTYLDERLKEIGLK